MCLGIPGRVLEVFDNAGLVSGRVDFGGAVKDVCLAYVPDAQVGEYVIVHVGFAISKVDEAEAHRTLAILAAMGNLMERELAQDTNVPGPGPARPKPAGAA
jgi:hydrogenase expression/formation protein HypC